MASSLSKNVIAAAGGEGQNDGAENADAMAALERQAMAPVGFVAASSGPEGGNRKDVPAATTIVTNREEIDLDEDD